jgi:UDP-hydrolysing UDP-N-acetyl-D-glucosamine 2-epimerase
VKKIAVATATRAEYGLLAPLLAEIRKRPALALQLIVTGAHLSEKYGHTIDAIRADGFDIAATVEINLDSDTRADLGAAMGACLGGFAAQLNTLAPDVLVILGDRYEMLAVAAAATIMGVPIAHLHGGELTAGAMDDSIRHAITKLSHLHFVAAEAYRNRVIQMGEMPAHVHNVGAIGIDNIATLEPMSRSELGDSLGIDLTGPFLLVTYHPETVGDGANEGLQAMLAVLARHPDFCIVITGVNADPGRSRVADAIETFRRRHENRTVVAESLGQRRYLSALGLAAAVVGNSSSGIIEAPAVGTPTVNIGTRQDGRLRSASVIDCDATEDAIEAALSRAVAPDFREAYAGIAPAYGVPGAARQIADILETAAPAALLHKTFTDIPAARG